MTDPTALDQTTDGILLSELSDGVLRLTLNDHKRRNALSDEMLAQLSAVLAAAAIDDAVRAIVIAANGPAFCAGHDLKQITAARIANDAGRADFERLFACCAELMQAIVNHPKAVIAEVAGVATAAGCQLVASCDLALAADTAQFATPGVNIGLFCSTPMVALSRNVTHKHAMEMLLTGDMIAAARAEQIGLINRVVDASQLTEQSMSMASQIASKSQMTMALGKRAFYQQASMPLDGAYDYASEVMVGNLLKQDAEEGIDAFIGKRPAHWRDQ